jgi:hypothetical protein
MRIEKNVRVELDEFVDADVDFDIEDVLDFINQANKTELNEIRDSLESYNDFVNNEEFITYDNLYDREKVLLLKEIFDKCNLEEIKALKYFIKGCPACEADFCVK